MKDCNHLDMVCEDCCEHKKFVCGRCVECGLCCEHWEWEEGQCVDCGEIDDREPDDYIEPDREDD